MLTKLRDTAIMYFFLKISENQPKGRRAARLTRGKHMVNVAATDLSIPILANRAV